jgi:hypothetical protein
MRGTQKRDKKNHAIVRVQKFNPGQIKYVRTLAVFFSFFFFSGRPLRIFSALFLFFFFNSCVFAPGEPGRRGITPNASAWSGGQHNQSPLLFLLFGHRSSAARARPGFSFRAFWSMCLRLRPLVIYGVGFAASDRVFGLLKPCCFLRSRSALPSP